MSEIEIKGSNRKEGMIMDIASLSVGMHTASLQNQVGVAMLSKSLDTMEDTGESMIKMMESSVMPHLGQNIDVSV